MPPAIHFEPDGYVLSGERLMGRQSAGEAFLRAAIGAMPGTGEMWAYTPRKQSADIFERVVKERAPGLTPRWCRSDDLVQLAHIGGLYLPGPDLAQHAQFRSRIGHGAYSLTGITHTLASHKAMDAITSLLTAPVMPWDALICTSAASVETVRVLLSEQAAMLRWRFGRELDFTLPLTPLIPLGVHLDDFAHVASNRDKARKQLGIPDDSVVLLFSGRLSFHAKAHPHAMYLAAERVAQDTGKKLVLIQNGWFANEAIERAFRDGTSGYAPNVRSVFSDGRNDHEWARAWAASDIFISLSDNIQETFGLTPIEAMAAGLPAIVTDWDGYKDTVRDGVDGFRIPTLAPEAGFGSALAARHEAGVDNYDFYCGLSCQLVSVDHEALAERLKALVLDPALRQRMGNAGQRRVREVYDWKVVFSQYQALWDQQARLRQEANASSAWQNKLASASRQSPNRLDPFTAFRHYPSQHIRPETHVVRSCDQGQVAYRHLIGDPLYSYAGAILPSVDLVDQLLGSMPQEATSIAVLAESSGLDIQQITHISAVLAKMGILRISSQSLTGE